MPTEREGRYLQPPWMQRHVGNRLAPLFGRAILSKLSVLGRRSGRWQTTPVAVLDYQGERYLVSYRGVSDWVLNLRASGRARLRQKGKKEEITVSEVPVGERQPLLEVYAARYSKFPTVAAVLRALPDPADHPIFRVNPARSGKPAFGIHVRFQAQPGKGDELAKLLLKAADTLADTDACRVYLVSRSPDAEEVVWVTEFWTNAAEHSASLESDSTRALIERASPLIAGSPDATELAPLGGKGLEH